VRFYQIDTQLNTAGQIFKQPWRNGFEVLH